MQKKMQKRNMHLKEMNKYEKEKKVRESGKKKQERARTLKNWKRVRVQVWPASL